MSKKRNPRIGSSLDDLLKAEGILEELQVQAVKEVTAWQLEVCKVTSTMACGRPSRMRRPGACGY